MATSGQTETYLVNKTAFSTDKYDEFSPVLYMNGIVFCSNRSATKLFNYSTEENKSFIKINWVDSAEYHLIQPVRFFSKKLNTKFNDGPVTFNEGGDTIYFSRNILTDGKLSELSSVRNKLGIFYAVYDGYDWTKIRELRINNEWYNVTTPWLSPDGKKLFFASDKPGGYGGSDIYYSHWKNDYWEDPVNLGPNVNTKGNESYPFMNKAGEFFFSSDGHPGKGGKDIFFTRFVDSVWIAPIALDPPVNSTSDDFGIFTDTLFNEGYFSSNRDKSLDIYYFKVNFPQIFYNSFQKENNYCFTFSDSGSIAVDTTRLLYKWLFDDESSSTGSVVTHCFPGPGKYTVRLAIVEHETGREVFTKLKYDLHLRDFEQAYINAPDYAVKGDIISFDGFKSYLPGFKVISYSWDFGDNSRIKGPKASHSFMSKGEYTVNLELALRSESDGQIRKTGVSKKIIVFNDAQEGRSYLAGRSGEKAKLPDIRTSTNADVTLKYSAETEISKDAVFTVELFKPGRKLDIGGSQFRNVPAIYKVKERLNVEDSTYSYTVEQLNSLMAAYPAYRKIISLGFRDAKIRMIVLSDQAEKELINLMRINGTVADSYFDSSDRFTSTAFIMLDQLVKLMNKYPGLKIEAGVHTDNTGNQDNNLIESQKRAQALVDYLINRGINARRLTATGYGSAKQIASNFSDRERRLNRRIEFTITGK